MKLSEKGVETKDEPNKDAAAKIYGGDNNLGKLIKVKEVELKDIRIIIGGEYQSVQ